MRLSGECSLSQAGNVQVVCLSWRGGPHRKSNKYLITSSSCSHIATPISTLVLLLLVRHETQNSSPSSEIQTIELRISNLNIERRPQSYTTTLWAHRPNITRRTDLTTLFKIYFSIFFLSLLYFYPLTNKYISHIFLSFHKNED